MRIHPHYLRGLIRFPCCKISSSKPFWFVAGGIGISIRESMVKVLAKFQRLKAEVSAGQGLGFLSSFSGISLLNYGCSGH